VQVRVDRGSARGEGFPYGEEIVCKYIELGLRQI